MATKKKEPKVWKSVRFHADTIRLIEQRSRRSGKPFSELIRQAVIARYAKPKKAKSKKAKAK